MEGGRPHRHSIRLTDEEQAKVEAIAAEADLTIPHLIAETVLLALDGKDRLTVADRRALAAELALQQRALVAIGRNLNQLTRTANATGHAPPETAVALRAVARAAMRVEETLGRLRGVTG